jgi:hypothetical protein
MSYPQQYLALWLVATISGVAFYNIGYDLALVDHRRPVRFTCHDGVVYRGVGDHWESLGQKCLTNEQMKGVT